MRMLRHLPLDLQMFCLTCFTLTNPTLLSFELTNLTSSLPIDIGNVILSSALSLKHCDLLSYSVHVYNASAVM